MALSNSTMVYGLARGGWEGPTETWRSGHSMSADRCDDISLDMGGSELNPGGLSGLALSLLTGVCSVLGSGCVGALSTGDRRLRSFLGEVFFFLDSEACMHSEVERAVARSSASLSLCVCVCVKVFVFVFETVCMNTDRRWHSLLLGTPY